MKAQANQIRPGWVIAQNGKQYSVTKIEIITPGKGGAFIQVEMRDIDTGNKTNDRWRTADTVERLTSEDHDCQYLYQEGNNLIFMQLDNYDQIEVPMDLMGEKAKYLEDNMEVNIAFIEGRPISVTIPQKVVRTIVETEPSIKGQTVTTSFKPAILDNGIKTMIPLFVGNGEKIVVNTEDGSYVERAK